MLTAKYSGFNLTDYFIIESVKRSILPPRSISTLDIPIRHGAYFTGVRYGIREITLDIAIIDRTPQGLMSVMRFLAFCLDVEEPSELIISDEPDKIQYAILEGDSEIERIFARNGRVSLTFLCPDPFAYSTEEKTISPVSGLYTFENTGTAKTYPKFTTTFGSNATFISLTSPDGVVLIGNPRQADKVVLPEKESVLSDGATSTAGWVKTTTGLDVGNTVPSDAAMTSIGGAYKASSYGTNPGGWHGPAFRKDLGETVKDFAVQAIVNFKSVDSNTKDLDGNMKGKFELYLYDVNGAKLGKFQIYDAYENYEMNVPKIDAGGTTLVEYEPKPPAPKKIKQKTKNSKGKTVYVTKTIYPTHVGVYNDFHGVFRLQRVGTTWYAVFYILENGKAKRIMKKTYYDKKKKLPTGGLAYIVLYFSKYNDDPAIGDMSVEGITVTRYNEDTEIDIPEIFSDGDVLEINNMDSSVWLNGEPFMEQIDVGSAFFGLEAGTTEVKVNTDDAAAVHSATYTERYL